MLQLEEERRILAQKYPNTKLLNLLSVWTQNTKHGKQVNAGYPKIVVETYPECLVIEFGRPACETAADNIIYRDDDDDESGTTGAKAKKDSLGRTIGYVAPHSHIRTAIFLKKETVKNEIKKLVEEEIKKRFGDN